MNGYILRNLFSATGVALLAAAVLSSGMSQQVRAAELVLADIPLEINISQAPLNMLVMGRDHTLYYEAYNDASDLDEDDLIDVGYKPASIEYYGYFDSYKCYTHDGDKFVPDAITTDKTCTGQWSGDFLNYVTTARIDALRKVLYGGYRSTDTTSSTVLERTHIPQDAHSWGKEYQSVARDGYDITDYTPLALPDTDKYHIFANTTLLNDTNQEPLLRVLSNTQYRVWEWVSIERPVAGTKCLHGGSGPDCVASSYQAVGASNFSGLTQTTYSYNGAQIDDHSDFVTAISDAISNGDEQGSGAATNIDGSGNPYGADDNFLTVFQGTITVPTTQTYNFAVDGDDAVEVLIDGTVVASWYGAHGSCNYCSTHNGSITLTAGDHTIIFNHHEIGGGDSYRLLWELGPSTMTDYDVRIEVCNNSVGLENNCLLYNDSGTSIFKPTGILHDYGENESMKFGLLTGSYTNNTRGGVLRKNTELFTDEVDPDTGIFTNVDGIIKTINELITINFDGNYQYDCGWIVDRAINNDECNMWGNPIGEMAYETLRYFMGLGGATSDFTSGITDGDDSDLDLPLATWVDPYGNDSNGDPRNQWCAKPFQTIISDVNVSFDTDQVPGSAFVSFSGDVSGFDAANLGQTIWNNESIDGTSTLGGAHDIYIGEVVGTPNDSAPTPKQASSFGNIRGLSPEAPTKEGGYYAASAAYFGLKEDLRPSLNDEGEEQNMATFSVALASPLPRIQVPIPTGGLVELVPFAKSVGGGAGGGNVSSTQGDFQPTNQIVDFYIEEIVNDGNSTDNTVNGGRYYAKFRINYEDVEQGADHDMDAIVTYTVQLTSTNDVQIDLSSDYAAGSIIHHLGYVISGTTTDGIYLEVRDEDTGAGSDPDYFLDTPNTAGTALPLTATRTFTPSTTGSSTIQLENPLWLAAKWGGFVDDGNTAVGSDPMPDVQAEWDEDADGDPDNYFLVTNALTLREQLDDAFTNILGRSITASPSTSSTGEVREGALIFRVKYDSTIWAGDIVALDALDDDLTELWSAEEQLPSATSRNIFTYTQDDITGNWSGVEFRTLSALNTAQQAALALPAITGETASTVAQARLDYIRGDQSDEGTWFRAREVTTSGFPRLIGDIVDSKPLYVGAPVQPYPENLFSGYQAYKTANADRTPVVYVGANGAMLHAIQATGFDETDTLISGSGEELFGYIPNAVFDNLPDLTSNSYSHKFYVNGSPNAGDVKIGSNWQTILVGSLGKGGQALFALDITSPTTFGASDVLWEFSDADDADLGYTFTRPAIRPTNSDHWVAIVGSGFNNTEADGNASTTGHGVIFAIDMETGAVLRKFDTMVGSTTTPNGITTIADTDIDGDAIVDYIYATDLQGNLWKIDLRSNNTADWDFAYEDSGTGDPIPLFQATDSSGAAQPITTTPVTGPGVLFEGQMIYFGTGKYLEPVDKIINLSSPDPQTFYAIWDRHLAGFEYSAGTKILSTTSASDLPIPTGRTTLLEQSILYEGEPVATIDRKVRVTSNDPLIVSDEQTPANVHQGWYIDLVSPNGFNGERQITRASLRNGAILIGTLIPDEDPCVFGNDGFFMILNALNGGRLSGFGSFDFNGDGSVNAADTIELTTVDTDGDGDVDADDAIYVPISASSFVSATGTQAAVLLDPLQSCIGEGCDVTRAFLGEDTLQIRLPRLGRQSWFQMR